MAHTVIMPKQGQSVESCIITKWHKAAGDDLREGDLLFSYETDKAAFDCEADASGKLLAVLAEEGDDVPCLEPVCVIGKEGEDIGDISAAKKTEEKQAEEQPQMQKKERKPEVVTVNRNAGGEIFVSPRARKTAERQGVDASLAMPTGANGRVMERDVYRLSEQGPQQTAVKHEASGSADYTEERLSNVRKLIARTMHESLSNMAQLTNHTSFDATNLLEARKSFKAKGRDITINDMILYAVSRSLLNHPYVNAHFLGDSMKLFRSVNLGVAVDTDRGLLVPTLYNADKKSLSEISNETKELIAAARSGRIAPELLANGTFTVTNLGALGVEGFTPVINPPQTAILGVCAIETRVRVSERSFATYPAMGLSLTYDHRAVDGAPAAKFAKELGAMMERLDFLNI